MPIMSCTCKHDFQDLTYGRGNRVFNERKEKGRYKCTVCGTERTSSSSSLKTDAIKTKKAGEKK